MLWSFPELMLLPLWVALCDVGALEESNMGLMMTDCEEADNMREQEKMIVKQI